MVEVVNVMLCDFYRRERERYGAKWQWTGTRALLSRGSTRGGSHLSGPGLGASGQLGWPTFGLTSQSLQMKQGVCTKM